MNSAITPPRMYQIGAFSRICSISVKALRHYQEIGLLTPSYIDEESSYRYYSEKLLERALEIQNLRELKFSLKEISEIFEEITDDDDLNDVLKRKHALIEAKIARLQEVKNQLNLIISSNAKETLQTPAEIKLVQIPDQHIASIRFKGRYTEVGSYFKKIFKAVGMQAQGKPSTLYFDEGYKETDADLECYLPVKKEVSNADVSARILEGGKAYCLIHTGSYDSISKSYKRIIDYLNENKIQVRTPSRVIYHKGPGMIFRGKPDKYITELQFMEV